MAFVKTASGWYEEGDPRIAGGIGPNGTQASLMTQGGIQGYNGLMAGFPELEAAATKTSGYDSIWNDSEFGQVPQATMDAYWQQATDNAMDKSRGAYASIFSERGGAPAGVGGQAEMLSRRARELSESRAGANVENAAQGARARAAAKGNISSNRYKVLTDPVDAYYRLQQGLGMQQPGTNSQTIARPSVPGGRDTSESGPGVSQRPQRAELSATGQSAGGVQLPGFQVNMQQPDYWGRPSTDKNYGQMGATNPYGSYNPNDRVGQNNQTPMPPGEIPTYGTTDQYETPYGAIYSPENYQRDYYA